MQLWKYTDDIVVFMIMFVWSVSKMIPGIQPVEDKYMILCLGYVFGNIVQRTKLQKEGE